MTLSVVSALAKEEDCSSSEGTMASSGGAEAPRLCLGKLEGLGGWTLQRREEVVTSYTFHGFGDVSEKACCAVVYLMLETSGGNYPVPLTSKTRVAPLAKQSIPRLELLSGVILARLASSVKEALQSQVQIDETYLWLDSKTAI